jgi:hypothetical protein
MSVKEITKIPIEGMIENRTTRLIPTAKVSCAVHRRPKMKVLDGFIAFLSDGARTP